MHTVMDSGAQDRKALENGSGKSSSFQLPTRNLFPPSLFPSGHLEADSYIIYSYEFWLPQIWSLDLCRHNSGQKFGSLYAE